MSRKARFEFRLDAAVHRRAKQLAEDAGLSMNQLLEGIVTWAVGCGHPGHPVPKRMGSARLIESREGEAVWFGDDGHPDDEGNAGDAFVHFVLDFSASRCVVDGWEYNDESQ